jgi:hypothetical protein
MDKAPNFGLPFFYRIVLPGTIVTVAGLPLLSALLSTLGIASKDQTGYLVGIGVVIGFALSLLDDPIYQLLEGRRGWPRWLATWRTRRWVDLVESKYRQQETLKEGQPEYDECWYLLRQFPVDKQGNPTVTRPSRIGNVIASYEQYSLLRYGMDDVFYWPRLWLLLDKDARTEIDEPWAAVDAILYTGCGVAAVGIGYLMLGGISLAWSLIGLSGPLARNGLWPYALAAAPALIAVFFLCLRIALPGLVANAERYKSVFDLYRSKLDLQQPTEKERKRWRRLAVRLQYGDTFGTPPVKSSVQVAAPLRSVPRPPRHK